MTTVAATPKSGRQALALELRLAWCLLAASFAAGVAVAALVVAGDGGPTPTQVVGTVVVILWAITGVTLRVRCRADRLSALVLLGTGLSAAWCLARAAATTGTQPDVAAAGWRVCAALVPAVTLHLLSSLPDGRVVTVGRRRLVATGYLVAGAVGVALCRDLEELRYWPLLLLWLVAVAAGGNAMLVRSRSCGALDRRRIQWLAWGVTVALGGILVTVALRLLTGWPHSVGTVMLAMSSVVPVALAASTDRRLVAVIDRLITRTVELTGLTAVVLGVYVIVVLGLGRSPEGSERTLLLLSMLAAGIAALLYVPARAWLSERANRIVYGSRIAPDETLRTFGERLTRSIPLDELLLQLAENLRASMKLVAAEVWTGQDRRYECIAEVPHRRPPPIEIGDTELPVIARAGVSGGTWLDIWIPQIVGPQGSAAMRLAPVARDGRLLGFIVVTRSSDEDPFDENEDIVLTEIARQIGLALHNVQLDAALQASLDELRVRNHELQSSRARIVSAGDAERRKLERNLHDGAQQHLVALAVKLRLAHDSMEHDPDDAAAMIAEIKGDVQTAITELRALAHGIFPPLLVSGGLVDALPSAAGRTGRDTTVEFDGVGRYGNDIEAAVYFCVLEALQNASKHAGDGARIAVRLTDRDGLLRFEIDDDGVGFDPDEHFGGHGFVNMGDRLGAIGGTIELASQPGRGTTITGSIPLT